MRKPAFGYVTLLLSALFFLVLFRIYFERYIPPLPPNKLENRPGSFLRYAVRQPVDWQPGFTDALEKCGRLHRPCLLVLGVSSSKVGMLMDQRVFTNWSVATYINTTFVPVRIDLCDKPGWRSAIFPLSRMAGPFIEGYQIAILDAAGNLERFISPPEELSQIDPTQFLDELMDIKADLESPKTAGDLLTDANRQENDLQELLNLSEVGVPHFEEFANDLQESSSDRTGAFRESGYLRMLPFGWRYLSELGHGQAAQDEVTRLLLSPACDLLRGGFYNINESSEDLDLDFSQNTVGNAEMALALAEMGVTQHDQFFNLFARQTFDMLTRDLCPEKAFIPARPSDLDPASGRSQNASFPMGRLNELLTPTEASWAIEQLQLDRFQNRQLVPYLASLADVEDPMYAEVMGKLRGSMPPTRVDSATRVGAWVGDQYLDVDAETIACLARCCRIWNDPGRLRQLEMLTPKLEQFVRDRTIRHTLATASPGASLGDYLAYADAQLQLAASTGEPQRIEAGVEVLRKAVHIFYDPNLEQMKALNHDDLGRMPVAFNNPDFEDDLQESTTAQALRLCFDYGRILGRDGAGLILIAQNLASKISGLSVSMSPGLASWYLSAASVQDPMCAFAVGPNAASEADALFRKRPSRLIMVANSAVRPDLLAKPAGLYVVAGEDVDGPFSVEDAAKRLPENFQVSRVR